MDLIRFIAKGDFLKQKYVDRLLLKLQRSTLLHKDILKAIVPLALVSWVPENSLTLTCEFE